MNLAQDQSRPTILNNLQFRIQSAKELLRTALMGRQPDSAEEAPSTPGERRIAILRRRQEAFAGGESLLLGEELEMDQEDQDNGLPDNVEVLADAPPEESIAIAEERADEFNRVLVQEGGKVTGHFHGTINSQTIHDPDEGKESDSNGGRAASVPTMSEAGQSKREMKEEVRADGGTEGVEQATDRNDEEKNLDGISRR